MKYIQVAKILKNNGYSLVRTIGSHCQYKKLGSPIITVPRHSSKDLSIGVLKSIEQKTGLLFTK